MPWGKHFEELLEYRHVNKDCNVPTQYKLNPGLGNWVMTQRRMKKSGDLTEDQIRKLDEIGFEWELRNPEKYWNERFLELIGEFSVIGLSENVMVHEGEPLDFTLPLTSFFLYSNTAYKVDNGHCKVPRTYKWNRKLGEWVGKQRTGKRNGKLTAKRELLLNFIGFPWEVRPAVSTNEVVTCPEPESVAATPIVTVPEATNLVNSSNGSTARSVDDFLNLLGKDLPSVDSTVIWHLMNGTDVPRISLGIGVVGNIFYAHDLHHLLGKKVPNNEDHILKIEGVDLLQQDIARLDGPRLTDSKTSSELAINDKIIEAFCKILGDKFPEIYFADTFVYTQMSQRGIKEVTRRLREKAPGGNLLKAKASYFPVHHGGNHWLVGAILNESKEIVLYNPFGEKPENKKILSELWALLSSEYGRLEDKGDLELNGWKLVDISKDCPRQENGECIQYVKSSTGGVCTELFCFL